MSKALYNACLLLLGLFALPKLLWQCLRRGKYRSSLRARLGLQFPAFIGSAQPQVIWMHAVSVGEVRAMATLFRHIHARFPERSIVVSTTTETGLAEAKRCMPEAKEHFILPLDFSWIMHRLVKQLFPAHLILCESDFWYQLLSEAKALGASVALVNGKISERSCRRFRLIPAFTKRLFSSFDLLCLQNEEYKRRFLSLGIPATKLAVTGNMKLEAPTTRLTPSERERLCFHLGITPSSLVLTIGSTHDHEEELLLDALASLWTKWPQLKVLLVPRHPERFDAVALLLDKKAFPYTRFSQTGAASTQLVLIDAMGQLGACYQVSQLAIVAGSYVPHIGGHNLFEPIQQGIPVFFGPFTHAQRDLKELVLSAHVGKEVPCTHLAEEISAFFSSSETRARCRRACQDLVQSVQGSTQKTLERLFQHSTIG